MVRPWWPRVLRPWIMMSLQHVYVIFHRIHCLHFHIRLLIHQCLQALKKSLTGLNEWCRWSRTYIALCQSHSLVSTNDVDEAEPTLLFVPKLTVPTRQHAGNRVWGATWVNNTICGLLCTQIRQWIRRPMRKTSAARHAIRPSSSSHEICRPNMQPRKNNRAMLRKKRKTRLRYLLWLFVLALGPVWLT